MNYELKQIRGVPYFLDGTSVKTFDLANGHPTEHCVPIGTYDSTTDRINYFDDWRLRVEPRLNAFRESLVSHARDTLRDTFIKPQKPRKTTRNPRKPTSRAKNPASV